ncbi:nuclear transport factor 2 family protein [Rhodococcoides yunnanense]|uniref:nuclear transport factor 2 family protein n=1 Tax=Rhodococcoides yunnanense TaxID=278209 RepID=UPI0009350B9A|nr:nuclear transport factor 2 family protein [Rhodococcus yunnanensis]
MSETNWAVHELLARYAHVVDNKEWDELASVFTVDAELDAEFADGEIRTVTGLSEIRGFVEGFDPLRSHHTLNTIVRTGPHGELHAWSRFLVVEFDATSLTGDYVDEIADTPDGLRIAKRRISTRNRPEGSQGRQESFSSWTGGR